MKVFVYTKKNSKKVATIVGVKRAVVMDGFLFLYDKYETEYAYDIKLYKISLFQN
jgi:hypothetical protein